MSNKTKAILFIILSAVCFSTMSACVRLAGDLPVYEKAFFRNLVAMLVTGAAILRKPGLLQTTKEGQKFVIGRAAFGIAAMVCNYYAIGIINLADANMLNKMSPFFAIIFSVFLLKEKVNVKQIVIVILAFCASLLIIKPVPSNLQLVPTLIGVLGGVGAGMAYTCARGAATHGVSKTYVVFYFSAFSTLCMVPLSLMNFVMPSLFQLIVLIICGSVAALAQISITTAYALAPARDISVFEYSQIIFSAIWGWILFAQEPDIYSVIGYVLIITLAMMNSGNIKLKKNKISAL